MLDAGGLSGNGVSTSVSSVYLTRSRYTKENKSVFVFRRDVHLILDPPRVVRVEVLRGRRCDEGGGGGYGGLVGAEVARVEAPALEVVRSLRRWWWWRLVRTERWCRRQRSVGWRRRRLAQNSEVIASQLY